MICYPITVPQFCCVVVAVDSQIRVGATQIIIGHQKIAYINNVIYRKEQFLEVLRNIGSAASALIAS